MTNSGLSNEPGTSVKQLATDLGLEPNMISRWRSKLNTDSKAVSKGSISALERENAELKRKLIRAEKERDFLKKTARYFAGQTPSDIK